MEKDRDVVTKLLYELEERGEKFIGPTVHDDVKGCKYPGAWVDTLRRYVQLANDSAAAAPSIYLQFYLDLCVTILTKRILALDIHYIAGGVLDTEQSRETTDMRIIHEIMFDKTVSRMLACVCECVFRCSPVAESIATEQTAKLYREIASLLKERFYKNADDSNYYARHSVDISKIVHDAVDDWLIREAFPNVLAASQEGKTATVPEWLTGTRILSDDLSFFGVSHCYWLWLHLTAAGIRTARTESDFLAMFYAFDLFIFCDHCSSHFLRHRPAFYTRDPYTVSVSTTYTPTELVFGMHNCVNRATRKSVMPVGVLSDYRAYWERYSLLEAGN